MNRFDECIEELEFLKGELKVHWEEHKRIRELKLEAQRDLDNSTKNIAKFHEVIQLLEKEKRDFESNGSNDNLPVMKSLG